MAVEEIPVQYVFICDGCGKRDQQKANIRPKYWSNLHLSRDAYDYQGQAVADGSTRSLLCDDCTSIVATAINTAIDQRRKEVKS